jgi:hypothetical protein
MNVHWVYNGNCYTCFVLINRAASESSQNLIFFLEMNHAAQDISVSGVGSIYDITSVQVLAH